MPNICNHETGARAGIAGTRQLFQSNITGYDSSNDSRISVISRAIILIRASVLDIRQISAIPKGFYSKLNNTLGVVLTTARDRDRNTLAKTIASASVCDNLLRGGDKLVYLLVLSHASYLSNILQTTERD
jgi:hypothetical protein